MRRLLFAALAGLAACSEPAAPPPPTEAPARAEAAPWFICDALDAPAIFVFWQDGATVRVAEYDKPNGAIVGRTEFRIGAEEGAAGSVYIALTQNGANAGFVRRINEGMLETPASAYTAPITSIRLGDREVACRWLPRTRLMGITGRRSIVVHEDPDGDLIYTSYNFADAAAAHVIDLSENGRSTTFSAEVRDGEEAASPEGIQFSFTNAGYTYIVSSARNGSGGVAVRRGEEELQSEAFVAHQVGTGGS